MAYATDKEPTGLTAKTTPVDADVIVIGDSADASEVAKKTTWANVKATLKTYFDTLYGNVTKVGTPVDNQVGVWTGDGTIEGGTTLTFDGDTLSVTNNNETGAATALIVQGDRATPTTNDEVIIELRLSDSAGNQDTMGTIRAQALDVTSTSEDSQLKFGTMAAGTLASRLALTSTQLGPNTDDGIALGSTALRWSDLYLAEGGVINWDNGDATLTQVGDVVTLAGADLKVTTPGTASTSVATIDGTQTLSNKRITRRVTTTNAPGATPTTNTDNVDVMNFTGLGTAITSMTTNLSGTPADGDLIMFRFTDDGTGRAITWGASFAATTVALPTTTVASTMLRVGFQYSGSTWKCIATA